MANNSDNNESLYDVFSNSQKQMFEQWSKAAATFKEAVGAIDPSQTVSDNAQQISKFYDTWKESTSKYLDALMSASPVNPGTDTILKMLPAADAYMKLYEFWEPLAKALQERAVDPDSYKDLVNPAKYTETVANVFGFGSSDATAGLYGHASDLVETWGAKAQLFVKPWSEAMRTGIDASLKAGPGDPEAGLTMVRSVYSAFERTFGKTLNMPAVGKDREQVELFSRTIDRYAVYLAKNAELQRQMHAIAQQAMEKVVENMAQKVKDGEQVTGFDEFVKLWTKTNEEAFLEFFKTEQFSELQGIVMDTALDCRRHFQQLTEVSLKDSPIALRSEMDDVCKANYTLRKSVRSLTKKIASVDEMREEIGHLRERIATLEEKLAEASMRPGAEGKPKKRRVEKTAG